MKIKELNLIRNNLYEEFCKIEEVQELLKYNDILLVYEFYETNNHLIKCFTSEKQVNLEFLKENGFTPNVFIKKLYTIDKQSKQVY